MKTTQAQTAARLLLLYWN